VRNIDQAAQAKPGRRIGGGKPGPGRPKGSKNRVDSARAKTAKEALGKLSGADEFIALYKPAKRKKQLGICFRILAYLYDQSHGRAAEQDVPGKGSAVKVYIGLTRREEAVIELSRKAHGPGPATGK
jgi:hypothetical protein